MVQMEINSSSERDLAVDLEVGWNAVSCEEEESPEPNPKNLLYKAYNGFVSDDTSCKIAEALMSGNDYYSLVESPIESGEVSTGKRFGGGGEVSPLVKKVGGDEKPKKKKSSKKPPRPPRPPSMDAVDQKILQEMAEIATLKRARIERMKALQKMKNSKSASSNNNLYALFITIIFCIMIIWQGLFSKGSSSERIQGSPVSPTGARDGFISVKLYKNVTPYHDSGSASPNNVEQVSGIDDRAKDDAAAGLV